MLLSSRARAAWFLLSSYSTKAKCQPRKQPRVQVSRCVAARLAPSWHHAMFVTMHAAVSYIGRSLSNRRISDSRSSRRAIADGFTLRSPRTARFYCRTIGGKKRYVVKVCVAWNGTLDRAICFMVLSCVCVRPTCDPSSIGKSPMQYSVRTPAKGNLAVPSNMGALPCVFQLRVAD